METRRKAKRRRVEAGPLIGPLHLPSDVFRTVLCLLDIPSLLLLSACNSALRREVFASHNKEALWSTIDFSTVPRKLTARLTDKQLKAFLTNCGAREVTSILKLTGLSNISGRGLWPLAGSCSLREADLSERLMIPAVFDVLASMPPIAPIPASIDHLGLSIVKFPVIDVHAQNYYDRFNAQVGDFMRRFHGALQMKAIEHKLRCGHCKDVIADKWSEEDMWWLVGCSYCEDCKKYTCRGGINGTTDCPFIRDCSACSLHTCQLYGASQQGMCTKNNRLIYDCAMCLSEYCEDCADEGLHCAADGCLKFYCPGPNGCADHLVYCEGCEGCYCQNCPHGHGCDCNGDEDNSESEEE